MILMRWSAAILVLLLGVLAVSYMQGRFDEGDLKKAIAVIEARYPDATRCQVELISRLRGHLKVQCWRNDQQEEWIVDLVHQTIGGK